MHSNDYTSVISPDLVSLIRRRGKRARLSAADIEDLQQIVAPKLAKARFDPQRNATALAMTIIDRQVHSMVRTRYRDRKVIAQQVREAHPQITPPEVAAVDLRLDVESMMRRLSPRDRRVCEGLLQGLPKRTIAAHLGCTTETVDCAIVRIRRKFADAGLGEGIGTIGRAGARKGGEHD